DDLPPPGCSVGRRSGCPGGSGSGAGAGSGSPADHQSAGSGGADPRAAGPDGQADRRPGRVAQAPGARCDTTPRFAPGPFSQALRTVMSETVNSKHEEGENEYTQLHATDDQNDQLPPFPADPVNWD